MHRGQLSRLSIKSVGDAISSGWIERGIPMLAGSVDMPDKTTAEGLFNLPYGTSSQSMSSVATRKGVPVGFWRSVGHSRNAFSPESFVDEMAFDLRHAPLILRRLLLAQAPRYLVVLELAASRVGWAAPCRQGGPRVLHSMNRLAPTCRESPRCLRLAASCGCTASCVPLTAVRLSIRALLRSKSKVRLGTR